MLIKRLKKKSIFLFFLIAFLVILISTSIYVFFYIRDVDANLPNPSELTKRNVPESTIIYDRNGIELYRFFSKENRELVKIKDVPNYVKSSLIASEDAEYYSHEGYNLESTIKCFGISLINKVLKKNASCGGSTLTQQLVRNTILLDAYGASAFERTDFLKSIDRKVKEIISAYRVETKYSKDEILQMYINEVPLGSVNYGLQTASKAYFGKELKDLTLSESATLIGFIQSPSSINPVISGNYEKYKVRREYVLNQILKNKEKYNITQDEITSAREEVITFKSKQFPIKAPHFIAYIKPDIESKYGIDFSTKGLRIFTTIDYSLQKISEEKLKTAVDNAIKDQLYVFNGGVLALSPISNQILAMVGSSDFWRSTNEVSGNINTLEKKLNMASSVKPYTYLTAIEKGYGPWLLTPDIAGIEDTTNADRKYLGLMSANKALVLSRNVSAMYVQDLVGRSEVLKTYKKLGISGTDQITDDIQLVSLGDFPMSMIEHTSAFNVFPSEGNKSPLSSIITVTDINGTILEDHSTSPLIEYYSNNDIYQMNWMLCRDGTTEDDALYMIDGKKVLCGKTGTAEHPRNLTTMMYHKNLMLGVWMGNTDGTVISNNVYSTYVSTPLAKSIMEEAKKLYIPEKFTKPDSILTAKLCSDTGNLKGGSFCKDTEDTIYKVGSKITKDTREYVGICKNTGTIPSSGIFLTTKYVNYFNKLNKKLELTSKQAIYDNYVKNNYATTINTSPEIKDCPIQTGDVMYSQGNDISGIVNLYNTLNSPAVNSTYGYNENIPLSFTIFQNGVNNFSDKYDKYRIVIDGAIPAKEITIQEGPYVAGTTKSYFKPSDLFEYINYGTPMAPESQNIYLKLYLIEKSTGKLNSVSLSIDSIPYLINIRKP